MFKSNYIIYILLLMLIIISSRIKTNYQKQPIHFIKWCMQKKHSNRHQVKIYFCAAVWVRRHTHVFKYCRGQDKEQLHPPHQIFPQSLSPVPDAEPPSIWKVLAFPECHITGTVQWIVSGIKYERVFPCFA